MNFKLIKKLSAKPELYQKGTASMWTDPYISQQLLAMHINPENDIASRSKAKNEYIAQWIMEKSGKNNQHILDLGCGPGLYAEMFAKCGHYVTGIDFSANSIHYAIRSAEEKKHKIKYIHSNYLELSFESQFDLIVMIYLDFCALLPEERSKVLKMIRKALRKGGMFICDVINDKNIDEKIMPASWEYAEKGFWRPGPYLALNKGYHYPEARVLSNHHIIAEPNHIESYIFWHHYYGADDFKTLLKENGFSAQEHEYVLGNFEDPKHAGNTSFYVIDML